MAVVMQGQHGQNLVFSNAAYNGLPASDAWMANSCLNPEVSHRSFGTEAAREPDPAAATAAVDSASDGMELPSISIAASPDSWSFQHFHDRVTHIILQGQHLTHTDTTYVTGREPDSPFVKALWNKLVPNAKQHVLHTREQHWPIRAKELIFSCRAPLVHPWFAQRLAEEAGVMGAQKPWADRKVILYCSRSRGLGGVMHNGGRSVTNEPAVINALETLLTVRADGERLEVFDLSQWEGDFDGMVDYFASQVRAVIGPHGGALVNINWASRATGVVEIMPSNLFSVAIYELAGTLGHRYGFMQSPSVNDQNDMTIDIPELMGIVSAVLNNEAGSESLQSAYMWNTNAHKL